MLKNSSAWIWIAIWRGGSDLDLDNGHMLKKSWILTSLDILTVIEA
jgi:hypothetical protein